MSPGRAQHAMPPASAPQPARLPPTNLQIMREQLEYLAEHVEAADNCNCSTCLRYYRVRDMLLEPFRS